MRAFIDFKVRTPRGPALHTIDWPGMTPAIVLIHPNRTGNRVWDHVVAESTLPNRFLAPGLRGHGLSDQPALGYRLTNHRDDLVAFIEALKCGPVFLVGQATGAMLALMVAHLRPDLVLAIMAANPAPAIPPAINDLVQSQVRAHASFSSRATARDALPFSSRWSDEIIEHTLGHALEQTSDDGRSGGGAVFRWRYHAAGVGECEAALVNDHSDAIRTDLPVLVFGGAEATVLPPATAERICALLPNHRRAVLPNADHRLSQDNPRGFGELMDRFILAQQVPSRLVDGGDFLPARAR